LHSKTGIDRDAGLAHFKQRVVISADPG
jgi:hypothetical protein